MKTYNEQNAVSPVAVRRNDLTALGPMVIPRDELERLLAAHWAEAMGIDEVGVEDDFFALGGTSLEAVVIFDRMKSQLGFDLPLSSLYEASNVRGLAELIADSSVNGEKQGVTPHHGVLVPINPAGCRAPLFVVPGVGGSVLGLGHLSRSLGPNYPVYGLESRGLHDDREPLREIEDIAGDFLSEIRRVSNAAPYRLFGICWGAVVAWEIARQLAAEGEDVDLLLLLDPPPVISRPRGSSEWGRRRLAIARFVWARLGLYWRTFRRLAPVDRKAFVHERLSVIREIARRRDLFRGDKSEFRRKKVLEANRAAVRNYEPQRLTVPTRLFFTADRPDGPSKAAREDWRQLVNDEREALSVPGTDTGDAISPQLAPAFAAALRDELG